MWNAMIGNLASMMVDAGMFIEDEELMAHVEKLRSEAEQFRADAAKSFAAGDTDRGNQQMNNARVMMQNAGREDPAAAKMVAAQMAGRMTQDRQGEIDQAMKARIDEIIKGNDAEKANTAKRREERAAKQKELAELATRAKAENWDIGGIKHRQGVKGRQWKDEPSMSVRLKAADPVGSFAGSFFKRQGQFATTANKSAEKMEKNTEQTAKDTAAIRTWLENRGRAGEDDETYDP